MPRRLPITLFLLLASSVSAAQSPDISVSNWTVPPYRAASGTGGYSAMTDISPGVGFVAMQPCRVVDTRGGGAFTGAYGPPAMAPNAQRSFDINSAPHCPGIPAGVDAYSLNFTVTQTAGAPGDIRVWPTGNPPPPAQITSVLNWTSGNATLANATIIPAGSNGSIDVYVAGTGTHLLIDVNGYFTDQYNPGVSFHAVSSTVAPAILAENTSTAATAVALQAVISSTSAGDFATAIAGRTNGNGYGVHGSSANGYGVLAGGGAGGVWATTAGSGSGVYGRNTGTTDGAAGVFGAATATSGVSYGVFGQVSSTSPSFGGRAGVLGVDSGGRVANPIGPAGVLGESRSGAGVRGLTHSGSGVYGAFLNDLGTNLVTGHLGYNGSGTNYGVYSQGPYGGGSSALVIEPHPMNADTVIRHAALVGNESGTYFRGRGKFQNGLATIQVPEDFRLVTDPRDLSVQVTPIGEMASVAVKAVGLDRVVVQGSRDVEFFYAVTGVRKTQNRLTPIGSGREYMPESAEAKMPLWLTEGQTEMLIANGTYKADGTVNMETARRLGWDKEWAKRGKPVTEPAPE